MWRFIPQIDLPKMWNTLHISSYFLINKYDLDLWGDNAISHVY